MQAKPVPAAPPAELSYLLVLEGDTSRTFILPQEGEVVIGRGEDAQLSVVDPAVSRTHVKLALSPSEVRLVDLGGKNGTFVNGERLQEARSLLSGDLIAVGAINLVYHAASPRAAQRLVPFAELHGRVEEEIERALRFRRPFSAVSLWVGPVADREEVRPIFERSLRAVDLASWDGGDALLVLLAETGPDGAHAAARRMLDGLRAVSPLAKAGIATYPDHGCDVATLLSRARRSALSAQPGTVGTVTRNEIRLQVGDQQVIVDAPAMVRVFALLERLSKSDLPVLLQGETGTGKDIAARALHVWSVRRAGPFVPINCAALPEQLVESELFGHERGAFSGAVGSKQGLIATANGGTLFLDEVGELPPPAQAKLLRVLETKQLLPVGAVKSIAVDVRVVTATNRNLEAEVEAGRFRRDLFYRIKGASLWIPPLRDRRSEIAPLADAFLRAACVHVGRTPLTLSANAVAELTRHRWPGNVRELQSVMEYAAGVVSEAVLERSHVAELLGLALVPVGSGSDPVDPVREAAAPELAEARADAHVTAPRFRPIEEEIRELETSRILGALAATGGNRTRAAELIHMPRRTFMAKLRDYRLSEAERAPDDDPE